MKIAPIPEYEDDGEYVATPTVLYEGNDYPEHNNSGFCDDLSHECHENPESIADLNEAIQEGEITPADADHIYRGKTVI